MYGKLRENGKIVEREHPETRRWEQSRQEKVVSWTRVGVEGKERRGWVLETCKKERWQGLVTGMLGREEEGEERKDPIV